MEIFQITFFQSLQRLHFVRNKNSPTPPGKIPHASLSLDFNSSYTLIGTLVASFDRPYIRIQSVQKNRLQS